MDNLINSLNNNKILASSKRYNFLNTLDLSRDVINRLSYHLDKIVAGDSVVITTPLGSDNNLESIINKVDELFDNSKVVIDANLIKLEKLNKDKIGPRSIAKAWKDRSESLNAYYIKESKQRAPEHIHQLSRVLRPISLDAGIKLLKNSTNSGLPKYVRKSLVKPGLKSDFESDLKRQDPCVLFTRTQEGNKTRNVWGYPVADTLNEMMFYKPLLDFQKRQNWRSALISPHAVDVAITKMMLEAKDSQLLLASLDFEAFDSTVKETGQRYVFDNYISKLYQNDANISERLNYIKNRFNTIGIITPDGVKSGKHGIPSGSTFTNEAGSIYQYSVSCEVVKNQNLKQVQGDDGAYSLNSKDIVRFMDNFKECGLKVNESKTYVSNDFIVYLQKYYSLNYYKDGLVGGIYPIYRALNRLMYQERFVDFKSSELQGIDYYSLRAITILENCKYHPLFRQFVKLIYQLDKYKLYYSQSSVENYLRIVNKGKLNEELIKNQYGDNLSGINDFETVKYLRELGWSSQHAIKGTP